ncbi:MAG: 50S ribosomal protein L24 [Anaerolineae bacterium]|jgi:large subunit ribosomal protein L24|nr:50S ribosomal protein L24 [Anaerolineae bacterium]
MKIKKGDTVMVITGEYKGKRGEVVRAIPKENKVVVKGVNIAKKHAKPRRAGRRVVQTGIIDVEMPIDVSNVKLIAPSGKPTRVNYRIEDGVKKRYSNQLDEVLD